MYQSPSSINPLPNAILFSITILLAQFLPSNLASTASPELHFEQFVSRQQFPRSSANDSAELLMAHGRRPPAENSAGFRANCSVPLCEGSLAPIFCSGPLLSSAWFFGVQQQCPGSRLLNEPNVVWSNFKEILRNNTIRKGDFMQFCEDNFETAAYLKPANLSDWLPEPVNFERITDKKMREFASSLHQIWPSLTREFVDDVHENQDRYPVLSVPNRFVVPGGFFKVYFYWDTYWILKGLYFSNLTETALGMLDNFAHVIHHHGFIPNSGNVQLSRRSQPPLFTQMLADYFGHTQNKTFLNHFLPFAEKELEWWHRNRSVEVDVDGQKLRMFQYKTVTDCPRPENFLEDYQLGIQTEDPRFFWSSTASACESGLDFSSRWYKWEGIEELRPREEEEEPMSRKQIATNHVLPVDLNVFMALNYETLAKLYGEVLGDKSKSAHFAQLSSQLGSAIDRAFYDKKAGTWFDRDLVQRRLRTKFYPSNIYPLLLKGKQQFCGQAVNYLRGSGALDFKGGIPSSLERDSNEQWDFPNGWAPQQHLFVASLLQCKNSVEAVDIARRVGEAFLKTALNGLFNPMQGKPAQMWEKYDVRYDNGRSGFGGEYPPQSGFGWTNGVVFEFIRLFYTSENGERLEKRAASSLNVAQDANAQGQLFVLDSLAGFFSTMNHHF